MALQVDWVVFDIVVLYPLNGFISQLITNRQLYRFSIRKKLMTRVTLNVKFSVDCDGLSDIRDTCIVTIAAERGLRVLPKIAHAYTVHVVSFIMMLELTSLSADPVESI